MIEKIASDEVLQAAFEWLCKARLHRHYNNDVWHLRFHWRTIKPQLQRQLLQGEYRFSPCRACSIEGHSIGVWNAQDALVQKAISWVLAEQLQGVISPHCYHVKGRGGAKAAVSAGIACIPGKGI